MFKPLVVFGTLVAIAGTILDSAKTNAQDASSQPGREMVSWVVLTNTHVKLRLNSLRARLDQIYQGQFPPRDQRNFVVDGAHPGQFLIQSNIVGASGIFILNSVPGPYTEFSGFVKSIGDPDLRRRAATQCCWLSVDLIRKHTNTTNEDAYRFIGRVLAALAPADAAALVHPSKLVTFAFDDGIRRRLASGEQIP